jgi:hypothetical protein
MLNSKLMKQLMPWITGIKQRQQQSPPGYGIHLLSHQMRMSSQIHLLIIQGRVLLISTALLRGVKMAHHKMHLRGDHHMTKIQSHQSGTTLSQPNVS